MGHIHKVGIPVNDWKQVETLVPKEASGEEGTGRNASKKLLWPFHDRLRTRPCLRCSFPEPFVLLVVLWCCRAIDDLATIEITDATNKIREHGFRELHVLSGVERSFWRKDLFKTLRERK